MRDKLREALRPFVEHSGDMQFWEQYGGEVYEEARAALAASEPSDLRAKLEALREAISGVIGYIAAREFHVSRGQISGSTRWELEQVRERLTAILEGKS